MQVIAFLNTYIPLSSMIYMKTESSTKKGKAIEHYIISEFLKNDFDVYVPVVDDGVDLIVRDKKGGFLEIQVKSRKAERDFFIKDFQVKPNFFIICHILDEKIFYVMPSCTFHNKSILKADGRRCFNCVTLKKYEAFKNEKGLELLEKALINPENILSSFVDKQNL